MDIKGEVVIVDVVLIKKGKFMGL